MAANALATTRPVVQHRSSSLSNSNKCFNGVQWTPCLMVFLLEAIYIYAQWFVCLANMVKSDYAKSIGVSM